LAAADLEMVAAGSPAEGLPEVRRRWRAWQRREAPAEAASSLPLVTLGLSHALSLVADLFAGPGRAVAVPQPFWGNYRQSFAERNGARLLTAPAYREGRFNPRACAEALAPLPAGEPAIAILNIPSNPGGYSPDPAERREMIASLLAEAARRPLLVVCDDAYAGLVFEPGIAAASPFWDLAGAHPNLLALKVDGATKEFSFFGGRLGFLTFPFAPESEAARALEAMAAALLQATAGGPPAAPQVVLLQALRQLGIEREIEAVRALLAGRYRALRSALDGVDPGRLRTLPFNSGCFALVELPEGLAADLQRVRRHLLERWDTGVIAIEPRYLRIAHCSVDAAALPELVRRLERGIAELATLLPRNPAG
jgi:aspartate/methionine/tyrosine aminotransferase